MVKLPDTPAGYSNVLYVYLCGLQIEVRARANYIFRILSWTYSIRYPLRWPHMNRVQVDGFCVTFRIEMGFILELTSAFYK